MFYHGVRHTPSGCMYRLGLALFDLENPENACYEEIRGSLVQKQYERHGDAQMSCSLADTPYADGDTLNIYYGAGLRDCPCSGQYSLSAGLAGRQ